jgi:hypothetical protein
MSNHKASTEEQFHFENHNAQIKCTENNDIIRTGVNLRGNKKKNKKGLLHDRVHFEGRP